MLCREWHQISITLLLVNVMTSLVEFFLSVQNVSGKTFHLEWYVS